MSNDQSINEQLNIRLKAVDKEALVRRAQQAGKSLPDWAREVLVSTIRFSPDYRALLAEFCSMRKVVLDIHAQLALNGQAPSTEAIKGIVEAAETNKFVMADRRIVSYLE